MVFKFIMTLLVVLGSFILFGVISNKRDARAIAARGGVRKMYSELFDAILEMPDGKIIYQNLSLVIATYRNNSNKACKIEVSATREDAAVRFYILYKDKWVMTAKRQYNGNQSGSSLLLSVALSFPDSDL